MGICTRSRTDAIVEN